MVNAFVSVLAFAAAAAAVPQQPYAYGPPSSSVAVYPTPSATSCDAQENACRTAPDANQAFCSAQRCACDGAKPYCAPSSPSVYSSPVPSSTPPTYPSATPSGTPSCDAQENACRTAPDANQAFCSAQRCACDGAKPYCAVSSAVPTPSFVPSSTPPTYPSATPSGTPSCDAQENACRTAPDANQAFCSAQRCACDGAKPYCAVSSAVPTPSFYSSASTPVAPSYTWTTTTAVVSSYTTVCPTPGTYTVHSKTYTVSSSTTLTVTDCPCTVQHSTTVPVTMPTPAPYSSSPAPPKPYTTTEVVTAITTYCPSATVLTTKGTTITVTQPTTVTISQCPGGCTVTSVVTPTPYPSKPVPSAPVSSVPVAPSYPAQSSPAVSTVPVYPVPGTSSAPVPPVYTSPSSVPVGPVQSSTAPVYYTPTSAMPSLYTGAADRMSGSAFAAAAFGIAAAIFA